MDPEPGYQLDVWPLPDLGSSYPRILYFPGTDQQPTEMQPADGYLLLALHTLWDIHVETGKIIYVVFQIIQIDIGLDL